MRLIDADAAIGKLGSLFDTVSWHSKGAVGKAIDIISSMPTIDLPETPPNDPLTLEELWEMAKTEERPVWVQPIGRTTRYGRWRIMKGSWPDMKRIEFIGGGWENEDEYGKTWLAYKEKPKKTIDKN